MSWVFLFSATSLPCHFISEKSSHQIGKIRDTKYTFGNISCTCTKQFRVNKIYNKKHISYIDATNIIFIS